MKIGVLLAAAVACTVSLNASAQTLSGTLAKINETGVISMGVRDQSVPFSYIDNDKQHIGYSISICQEVVKAVRSELKRDDIRVEMKPTTPATRVALMANGTIDLECSTATNNAARQQQVAFSNTIFLTANKFVAKQATGIRSIEDLRGKRVAVPAGTSNLASLNEVNQSLNLGIKVMTSKDTPEGFLMMQTDRVDAFVVDDMY